MSGLDQFNRAADSIVKMLVRDERSQRYRNCCECSECRPARYEMDWFDIFLAIVLGALGLFLFVIVAGCFYIINHP